jgi:uncharacterized protein YjeT (DUF2065 family)
MKTVLQYLFALVLVIFGIVLLCNPSRPATMTSEVQSAPDSNSQMVNRPVLRPTMRLA